MKFYLLLILFLFIGCAAQMAPKGGPLDEKGPVITQILPSNLTDISNTNTQVIIHFDEFINPLSVVNTIEVLNFNEFNYQVRGKRIIINPNHKWPSSEVIKINISRKISDFHNNMMDSPIKIAFTDMTNNIDKKITGHIINSESDIFQIGLYQIIDQDYYLIDKTESNIYGSFEFKYLNSGQYIAAAVENFIDSLAMDIRNKRYGFITDDFIDLENTDSTHIMLKIDYPLEQFVIKSFRQINNSFGYVLLNNGKEKPFFIPSTIQLGDSLEIALKLSNRIESYTTPIFKSITKDILDTLPPQMNSYEYIDDRLNVVFNEPIARYEKAPKLYYAADSVLNIIDYNFINSFIIQSGPTGFYDVYISNIYDLYSNALDDTLFIKAGSETALNDSITGGNIYGHIKYNGQHPVIVKAESLDQRYVYYNYVDSLKQFYFSHVMPGMYNFNAYEILGDYDSTQYYSGSWKPYRRAAKFGMYNEQLEVRNHWDIQDMLIEVK
tara:strand:- start:1621 stop:3105 length:1485 start_codon:yes stop_codon:yes gene_type:complete